MRYTHLLLLIRDVICNWTDECVCLRVYVCLQFAYMFVVILIVQYNFP